MDKSPWVKMAPPPNPSKFPLASLYRTIQSIKVIAVEEKLLNMAAPRSGEYPCFNVIFTKTKDIRCLNLNNTKEMIDGYKCHSPNSRLEGDTCINYEVVSAK